jgi:hypothetical protein
LAWACARYRKITGRCDLNPEDLRGIGRQHPLGPSRRPSGRALPRRGAAQAYDLVVLDTAPAPDDPATCAALGTADQVFLICDPGDPGSVESAAALALLVRDLGRTLGAWHLVCKRKRPGAGQPETVAGYCRDLRLPIALAAAVPDESERHLAMLRVGRPVALDDMDPASPGHCRRITPRSCGTGARTGAPPAWRRTNCTSIMPCCTGRSTMP